MAVSSAAPTALLATAPPLAGSGTTAAPAAGSRPAPSGGGFSDPTFMYLVLLAIGGMLVFSIFSQRKERKRRDVLLGGLKKHDRVQTIGGVIGSAIESSARLRRSRATCAGQSNSRPLSAAATS